MRTDSFTDDLIFRLRDKEYASRYLDELARSHDQAAFLLGLSYVIRAQGGVGKVSKKVGLSRQALYKILSNNGNPTIETMIKLFRVLGFSFSVSQSDEKKSTRKAA